MPPASAAAAVEPAPAPCSGALGQEPAAAAEPLVAGSGDCEPSEVWLSSGPLGRVLSAPSLTSMRGISAISEEHEQEALEETAWSDRAERPAWDCDRPSSPDDDDLSLPSAAPPDLGTGSALLPPLLGASASPLSAPAPVGADPDGMPLQSVCKAPPARGRLGGRALRTPRTAVIAPFGAASSVVPAPPQRSESMGGSSSRRGRLRRSGSAGATSKEGLEGLDLEMLKQRLQQIKAAGLFRHTVLSDAGLEASVGLGAGFVGEPGPHALPDRRRPLRLVGRRLHGCLQDMLVQASSSGAAGGGQVAATAAVGGRRLGGCVMEDGAVGGGKRTAALSCGQPLQRWVGLRGVALSVHAVGGLKPVPEA